MYVCRELYSVSTGRFRCSVKSLLCALGRGPVLVRARTYIYMEEAIHMREEKCR